MEKVAAQEKEVRLRRAYEKMEKQLGTTKLLVEVWLDEEGRVRRLKTTTPLPEEAASGGDAQGGGRMTVVYEYSVVYEYYDFGAPVRVSPPPAGQTADVTDRVMRQARAS